MSGSARALSVIVRVVAFPAGRRLALGSLVHHEDGIGVIAAAHAPEIDGLPWLHCLLFLAGTEYTGDKDIAKRILERALTHWVSANDAQEIIVNLAV